MRLRIKYFDTLLYVMHKPTGTCVLLLPVMKSIDKVPEVKSMSTITVHNYVFLLLT